MFESNIKRNKGKIGLSEFLIVMLSEEKPVIVFVAYILQPEEARIHYYFLYKIPDEDLKRKTTVNLRK